jgi:hypothetical protein
MSVEAPAMLKVSALGVGSPVFKPPPEGGGGGIGTNIIGPRFEKYVQDLDADDPITVELVRLEDADIEEFRELATARGRHVVLLGKSS